MQPWNRKTLKPEDWLVELEGQGALENGQQNNEGLTETLRFMLNRGSGFCVLRGLKLVDEEQKSYELHEVSKESGHFYQSKPNQHGHTVRKQSIAMIIFPILKAPKSATRKWARAFL